MAFFMNLISRPGAVRVLNEARALLADETPLHANCGKHCGAACCQSDDSGENGMLLYPFEETFYSQPIEGFAFRLIADDTLYRGGKRLVCDGKCLREHRPLACRLFPLRVRVQSDMLGEHATAVPEIDPRAWLVCPLPDEGGIRAMSPTFVEAVRQAGEALIGNVYMLEALWNEQRMLDEMRTL